MIVIAIKDRFICATLFQYVRLTNKLSKYVIESKMMNGLIGRINIAIIPIPITACPFVWATLGSELSSLLKYRSPINDKIVKIPIMVLSSFIFFDQMLYNYRTTEQMPYI